MHVEFWIVVSVTLWFGVELGVRHRGLRVALQSVMVLGFCFVFFSVGSLVGKFEPNLAANNRLKNLTRGLVAIAGDEDFDRAEFLERLKQLEQGVIPTYETQSDSREAVVRFLGAYNMEFEDEIPIEADQGVDSTSE
ncbi:hypothetical protein NG895_22835 [Aeoliella sp. ICT_H6.2]|uniref:Uncharacterized protein n=1 Tax=Aeoliella straminimaris TaxID=2954799 RepID=A0A9X2FEI7_9BACT|nr:hypothetical protein [Aeoliella straminimaris]MCO6046743.1 hypothetical protein [Aeoliella straminimaris]